MQESQASEVSTPCRYFYRSGDCRRGDKCKFSHVIQRAEGQPTVIKKSRPTTGRAKSQLNPASAEFKPRQPKMVTMVSSSDAGTSANAQKSQYDACGICTEIPSPFAQLLNCNHYFCVDCLKRWRSKGEGVNRKHCPTCRAHSDYIYVLSEPQADAARLLAIQRHKDRLKQIPCKHFTKTAKPRPPNSRKIGRRKDEPPQPFCIFGDACLYKHEIDGKPFLFRRHSNASPDVPEFLLMQNRRRLDRWERNSSRSPEAEARHREWLAAQALRHSLTQIRDRLLNFL